jgi:hypothetical protein
MNVKIALLAILVILTTATIVITTNVALNEVPSVRSIETNIGEESSHYVTFSGEVQPQGDPREGGWPTN